MLAPRGVVLLRPAAVILASYGAVGQTVWGMRSPGGRRKAVGTCGSHLTAVCLFYGSATYTYLQPTRSYNQGRGKFVSLFYTVLTPALNPLTYSLRNKEVKGQRGGFREVWGGGRTGSEWAQGWKCLVRFRICKMCPSESTVNGEFLPSGEAQTAEVCFYVCTCLGKGKGAFRLSPKLKKGSMIRGTFLVFRGYHKHPFTQSDGKLWKSYSLCDWGSLI
ncbi:Putative olfactory receptor 2I1 [Fukomys damarensis]|uniref:Putative olfactory receptor 2I1 n=1 Tax=Fukomys damarensis TaxID=885580 RepID=A0A091CZ18_FUKDA|nr:Putative olfactory receptor 2I1 [Fukomys damarensis]